MNREPEPAIKNRLRLWIFFRKLFPECGYAGQDFAFHVFE